MNVTPITRDPNAILISDEEMEKLLATKPADATVAFVSTDDADETEEDKVLN